MRGGAGRNLPQRPCCTGGVDLDVDGVVGLAAEPRIRVRGEEDVCAHLCRIADVVRDEVVQARRDLASGRGRRASSRTRRRSRDPAERHPDEQRDREKEPEEDREPGASEVVVANDEADRSLVADIRHARILEQLAPSSARRLRHDPTSASAKLVIHIASPTRAMAYAPLPAGNASSTWPASGWIRWTTDRSLSVTQTSPSGPPGSLGGVPPSR